MAKKYIGENAIAFLVSLLKGELTKKVDNTDARLSDSRAPKVHADSHAATGSDPISPASIGAVAISDIVDSLVRDDTNRPLSANQGKVLAAMIANINISGGFDDALAALKGQPDGLCPLDNEGIISSDYLPSYVDDVIEGYYFEDDHTFYYTEERFSQIVGQKGVIYVDLFTNNSYRWSGSTYVLITSSDMVEFDNTEIESIWSSIMNLETASNVSVIEFTIIDKDNVSKTFYASEFMTWDEWVSSVYNIDSFFLNEDSHVSRTIDGVTYCLHVASTDQIVSNGNYSMVIDE